MWTWNNLAAAAFYAKFSTKLTLKIKFSSCEPIWFPCNLLVFGRSEMENAEKDGVWFNHWGIYRHGFQSWSKVINLLRVLLLSKRIFSSLSAKLLRIYQSMRQITPVLLMETQFWEMRQCFRKWTIITILQISSHFLILLITNYNYFVPIDLQRSLSLIDQPVRMKMNSPQFQIYK